MALLLYIIISNFLFSAYYSVGDTINEDHLNASLEVCHGADENDTGNFVTLGDNLGKITIIGLEIPW